jgi:hypothetical protein
MIRSGDDPRAGRGAAGGTEADAGSGRDSGRDPAPDLRDGFAALRRHEEQAAPSFATFAAEAARRRRGPRGRDHRWRPLAVAAATAAAVLGALAVGTSPWLRTHLSPSTAAAQLAPSISAWRPATDFLLRTPAQEILSTSPTFGRDPSLGLGNPPSTLNDTSRRP